MTLAKSRIKGRKVFLTILHKVRFLALHGMLSMDISDTDSNKLISPSKFGHPDVATWIKNQQQTNK